MEEVVRMRFGSHLYGTNTPQSDLDFKAVYIPDARDIILGRVKDVVSTTTKTNNLSKNTSEDIDTETISLHKYLKLVAEGQTVAIDMLFAPSWAITPHRSWTSTPTCSFLWTKITNNKHKLLSKKYMGFVGYVRTQANKYGIKGSRMNDCRQVVEFLGMLINCHEGHQKLTQYSDELNILAKSKEFVNIVTMFDNSTKKDATYLEVCGRKTPMNASVKTAYDCYKRLWDEYGERARQAATNDGIDWKALSHAVRIGEQALELFRTGNIVFPRVNAQDLLEIKLGKLQYKVVADRIEDLLEKIELEAGKSRLANEPDYKWIEEVVEDEYSCVVKDYYYEW